MSALLQLCDEALPHAYGYLVRRCDSAATAEDLTADCDTCDCEQVHNADPTLATSPPR